MKGLSFSEPMVKAWLRGEKSLTRRLMNPQPDTDGFTWGCVGGQGFGFIFGNKVFKPRYLPGEVVYIKETWAQIQDQDVCLNEEYDPCPIECGGCHIEYKADTGNKYPGEWPDAMGRDPSCPKWKSPRFMPEWASRSHARIVSVRPERVQEISRDDAALEGFGVLSRAGCPTIWDCDPLDGFYEIWETLHPGSWERNDWVWRIELEKIGGMR